MLERSIRIRYRPVLFAALLAAHGHKGPAEIASKRRFTYRFVVWQAAKLGIPRQTLEWKIRTLDIDKLRFRKR